MSSKLSQTSAAAAASKTGKRSTSRGKPRSSSPKLLRSSSSSKKGQADKSESRSSTSNKQATSPKSSSPTSASSKAATVISKAKQETSRLNTKKNLVAGLKAALVALVFAILLSLVVYFAFRESAKTSTTHERIKFITESVDSSVNPCDDFHGHACARYERRLRKKSVKDMIQVIEKSNDALLMDALRNRTILRSRGSNSSRALQALADMYGTCRKEATEETEHEQIKRLANKGLIRVMGVAWWPLLPGDPLGDPTHQEWYLEPLEELYLISSTPALFRVYHMQQPQPMLTLTTPEAFPFHAGYNRPLALNVRNILSIFMERLELSHPKRNSATFQRELFEAREEIVKLVDRLKSLQKDEAKGKAWKGSLEKLGKDTGLDWRRLVNWIIARQYETPLPASATVALLLPRWDSQGIYPYFRELSRLLLTTSSPSELRAVKNLLGAMYIYEARHTVPSSSIAEMDPFLSSVALRQQIRLPPTSKPDERCLAIGTALLGPTADRAFIEALKAKNRTHFDETLRIITSMITQVNATFKHMIQSNTWLPPPLKARFLTKIDTNKIIIGFEPWLLEDSSVDAYLSLNDSRLNFELLKLLRGTETGSSFLEHFLTFKRMNARRKLLNISAEHVLSIREVNSHFSRDFTLTLNLGLMQYPSFHPDSPAAINYGSYGTTIGHELAHTYDALVYELIRLREVNLIKELEAAATNSCECLQAQYSDQREEFSGEQLNGFATLVENAADDAGVKAAYWAWQNSSKAPHAASVMDPAEYPLYTPEQLFFYSSALFWCDRFESQAYKKEIRMAGHSLPKFRTNIPFANFDEFSRAFNCPAGSAMNPVKKCAFW